ncbi:hypothetical protein CPB86DRAFT_753613 [Serendipita vermifera]|nr:hypothetical protein CPB86DRAFT_753613 [Serendipita vermifera]
MLHFRIHYQHAIKPFLVEYDSDWSVVAAKVAGLFPVPEAHVVLMYRDRDGTTVTLRNQKDLRDYLLGPRSARAVAGLPLDFALKDLREWKYSIVSEIPVADDDDLDFTQDDVVEEMIQQAQTGKFTDEDYTFVQPDTLETADTVHLVVPGESGFYSIPRHAGIGSTPNLKPVEIRQDDEDNTWDNIKSPADGKVETIASVEYPNIHLEEPSRPHSAASSGPPRISAKEKGKGRAVYMSPMDPLPLRLPAMRDDLASDKSVVNNDVPQKPTIHVPDVNQAMSPIPLISNIVKKMSLENAKARTIGEEADDDDDIETIPPHNQAYPNPNQGYDTLVTQLVSLVDVVTQLLEDDGVAHQIRSVWDGFSMKEQPTPISARTPGGVNKPKEIALAEGIVTVMKKVQGIVDDVQSDVEEHDDDVIWTHKPRPDLKLAKVESKPTTPTTPHGPKSPKSPRASKVPPPISAISSKATPISAVTASTSAATSSTIKSSKQRLEEAKALYKAEKARYRAEREQKRRDKITARGFAVPETPSDIREPSEAPIEVKPADPGRKASLMSVGDTQARPYPHIDPPGRIVKLSTSAKPTAGSSYSPVLLPANLPRAGPPSSVAKMSVTASTVRKEKETSIPVAQEGSVAGDADSEGPGTPKAPPRPSRDSSQFDFDAFMEANAWNSKGSPGWAQEQQATFSPPVSKPSVSNAPAHHMSMPAPPRAYVQGAAITDSPHAIGQPIETVDNNTAPTPPPRPHTFSPPYAPPLRRQTAMESLVEQSYRANPLPRVSSKRNRWGDGTGSGRRLDVGVREDSIGIEAHPPPVYSTDGEGAEEVLESGGPVRVEKGQLPLNEEFKRRCLAVLHEYNVTQDQYPNIDVLISQGIQIVAGNRQMVRLAAESNPQAREKFLSEEVPNVVNRVVSTIQRGGTPNYV